MCLKGVGVLSIDLWHSFSEKERKEYIDFLKIFGALSGLFKDNKNGTNADKPFLHYRNHEQLFARIFNVQDLTRKDSAFDVVAKIGEDNIGVGLKTWIHTRDFTYQKIAEFNKLAPEEIVPLINHGSPEEVIHKVSELRNERIQLDKRLYNTKPKKDVYHNITRNSNVMNIVETPYDLVQLDSLVLKESNGKTFTFSDGLSNYKFYASKSVMLKEFDASSSNVIQSVPINQFDDPFKLIQTIQLPVRGEELSSKPELYLPLYSILGSKSRGDRRRGVPEGAGINKWHRKKEKNRRWDVEVRIPKWIHEEFNGWFFGHDFIETQKTAKEEQSEYLLNNRDAERIGNRKSRNYVDFKLKLPNGDIIEASVNGANGKNFQSKRSKDLGIWLLHVVFGMPFYVMEDDNFEQIITIERLKELDIDSVKLTMLDEKERLVGIDVAEYGSFEAFTEKYGRESLFSELVEDEE